MCFVEDPTARLEPRLQVVQWRREQTFATTNATESLVLFFPPVAGLIQGSFEFIFHLAAFAVLMYSCTWERRGAVARFEPCS